MIYLGKETKMNEQFPHQNEMQAGSIVELVDATNLDLEQGVLGTLTSPVLNADKRYVTFMPETNFEMFVVDADRVRLMTVEELVDAGIQSVYPELPEELKVDAEDTVEDYLPLLSK